MGHPERFDQLLRRLRQARGLTQRELSRQAFCSLDTIKKLETAARLPSRHLAEHLAAVLALTGAERQAFLASASARSPRASRAGAVPHDPGQPAHPAATSVRSYPTPGIPLIGRAVELAELQRLLADPAVRLLTILGPGGSGKSRLAQALVEQLAERDPHGACCVPLAALNDPTLLPQAVAAALQIGLSCKGDPGAQVLNWLRDKQLLLVLDNFEQLRGATPWLQELLAVAPGLQLLVTSRERLHLAAEWVFDLPGLAVPPPDANQPADWAAGALFVHWLRRTRAGTPVAAEELPQIAAICRLVEGLPLAIELAASWARTLSCAEIARELAAGSNLLVAPTQDVPARHASIRAVFAHSWRLLAADERWILERCAVFRGGFTAELASAVAAASLPLLAALIDKTLLRRSPAGRFVLHELARQYAEEQLALSGELATTRDRHLTAMIELAEAGAAALRGPDQFAWYQRLAAEGDNLRAALVWAAASGQAAAGLRLAGACGLFWLMRSHIHEGYQLLQRSLEQAAGLAVDATHRRALFWAGRLAQLRGDPLALSYFEELLAIAGDDTRAQAYAMLGLGDEGWPNHDSEQKLRYLDAALERFLSCGDHWGAARAYGLLSQVTWYQGDFRRAEYLIRLGLALCEVAGDQWSAAWCRYGRGMCFFAYGEHAAAAADLAASLAVFEQYGDLYNIADVCQRLGVINLRRARIADAAAHLALASRLWHELGLFPAYLQPATTYWLGMTALAAGDVAGAQAHFLAQRADAEAGFADLPGLRDLAAAFAACGLAQIAARNAELEHALELVTAGLRLGATALQAYPSGQFLVHEFLCLRADLLLRLGSFAAAAEIYAGCLAWYAEHADRYGLLLCLRGIAVLAQHRGQPADAVRLAATADRLGEAIDTPVWPVYRAAHQAWRAELQAALSADAYVSAWAAGRAAGLAPADLQRVGGTVLDRAQTALQHGTISRVARA